MPGIRCFNCLQLGHSARECADAMVCTPCNKSGFRDYFISFVNKTKPPSSSWVGKRAPVINVTADQPFLNSNGEDEDSCPTQGDGVPPAVKTMELNTPLLTSLLREDVPASSKDQSAGKGESKPRSIFDLQENDTSMTSGDSWDDEQRIPETPTQSGNVFQVQAEVHLEPNPSRHSTPIEGPVRLSGSREAKKRAASPSNSNQRREQSVSRSAAKVQRAKI